MEMPSQDRGFIPVPTPVAVPKGEPLNRRSPPSRKRWGRLVVAVAAVFGLVIAIRSRSPEHKPVNTVRFTGKNDALPATLADLNDWYAEPEGSPNAAVFYLKACDALKLKTRGIESLPLLGNGRYPALDGPVPAPMKKALEALLKSNADALHFLAEGAKYGRCRYALDFLQGSDLVYRPFPKLENAGFLVELAALYHADSNQPEEAAHDLLIAFSLADSLAQIPSVLPQLLRRRINRSALDALEQTLNRASLPSRTLDNLFNAVAKMEAADARGEIIGRALAGERVIGLAAIADPPQLGRGLMAPDLKMSPERRRQISARLTSGQPLGPERAFFEKAFGKIVAARQKPFPQRLESDSLGGDLVREADEQGLFALDLLLPNLGRRTSLEARCLAQLRVACAALALERFRAAHQGHYPENLYELTPDFLTSIPVDPFDGNPMCYHSDGNSFTITTLSPNRETSFSRLR